MKESERVPSKLTADMPDTGHEPHRGLSSHKDATVHVGVFMCKAKLRRHAAFLGEHRIVVGRDMKDCSTAERIMALCLCRDGREYSASIDLVDHGDIDAGEVGHLLADALKQDVIRAEGRNMTRTERFLRYGKESISNEA